MKLREETRNPLRIKGECGAEVKKFRRPFRPRPVKQAFSRRENHQFYWWFFFMMKSEKIANDIKINRVDCCYDQDYDKWLDEWDQQMKNTWDRGFHSII